MYENIHIFVIIILLIFPHLTTNIKSFYDNLNLILCNGQNQNLFLISRINFIDIIFLLHSFNKKDVIIVTCWIYECILLYD